MLIIAVYKLLKINNNIIDFFCDLPDGDTRTDQQTAILGLPGKLGGLGILSYTDTKQPARTASLCNSRRELIQRNLTTIQHMADLAEQLTAEGTEETMNPYTAVGQMPTVDEELQNNLTQKQLTTEIMVKKQQNLVQSLSVSQLQTFTDNMASTKWLSAIPHGAYNRLSDKQIAANLNILQLRPKHTGQNCLLCGDLNGLNEYETCRGCKLFSQQTHARHNYIRDKIVAEAQKSTNKNVQKEPLIYSNLPNPPNQQRADFSITTKPGQPAHHQYFGMFDIMTKVVFSVHASTARDQTRITAELAGVTDPITICRHEIQAALQVGVAYKN